MFLDHCSTKFDNKNVFIKICQIISLIWSPSDNVMETTLLL